MSCLNVEVSYFPRHNRPAEPHNVNLLAYLRSAKHREAVERIRATDCPKVRTQLKEALPGITPSGTFTYRDERHLVKHSGLIAADIDLKENPYTPESLKEQLRRINEVAYCGLSVSGRGLWLLIPIADPTRHKEHFAALVGDFARLGVHLDKAPANVASFRYFSHDPAAYINHAAKPFAKWIKPSPDVYAPQSRPGLIGNDADKVAAIVDQIEARHIDVTGDYKTWFSIGCALAGAFGESGRDTFHRISRFGSTYHVGDTERQFSRCLRMKANRIGLGTLFDIARRHGVEYKGHLKWTAV